MNLEHYRKAAKRLRRDFADGDSTALARAQAVLGARCQSRLRLSDAQHVVAVEGGYRSWPELRAAADPYPARLVSVVETDLEYRPGERVRVSVVRRGRRVRVSDDGVAIAKAGRPPAWRTVAGALERGANVNVSGPGAVWLPVVPAGPGEEAIVARIAAASRRFYDELLELQG
jgi:hypothetical protein